MNKIISTSGHVRMFVSSLSSKHLNSSPQHVRLDEINSFYNRILHDCQIKIFP